MKQFFKKSKESKFFLNFFISIHIFFDLFVSAYIYLTFPSGIFREPHQLSWRSILRPVSVHKQQNRTLFEAFSFGNTSQSRGLHHPAGLQNPLDLRTNLPDGPIQLYIATLHYAVVHMLSPRTNLRPSLQSSIDQDSKIVRASLTRRSALLGRHRPGFVTLPPSVFHLKGFRQSVPNHWPA